jgi:hypothetical protein
MATKQIILTERELTNLIKKIVSEVEETDKKTKKKSGGFGWVKSAAREIAELFKDEILPEIPEDELKKLKSKARELDPKSAIDEIPHFANSEEGEESLTDAEKKLGDDVLIESIINEGLSERMVRVLTRTGVISGIGMSVSGLMTYASTIMGYIDSDFLKKVHEIVDPYCSAFCGPLGLMALILGTLLAIGSAVAGYPKNK